MIYPTEDSLSFFYNCQYCYNKGIVLLVREDGYEFNFRCCCFSGDKNKDKYIDLKKRNMPQWNGKLLQVFKGHKYTPHHSVAYLLE